MKNQHNNSSCPGLNSNRTMRFSYIKTGIAILLLSGMMACGNYESQKSGSDDYAGGRTSESVLNMEASVMEESADAASAEREESWADKDVDANQQVYANSNFATVSSDNSSFTVSSSVVFDSTTVFNPDYKKAMSSKVVTQKVNGRQLIVNSNLRFRVKDVFVATQELENLAQTNNGFILNSRLSSSVNYTDQYAINADSALKISHITTTSNLKVRVPVDRLDDYLQSLAPMIEFLDTRNISANDVTLDLLSNELIKKRNDQYASRLSKKITAGKKLNNIVYAEDRMLAQQRESDLAITSKLELEDQIAFATITMDVYQPQMKQYETIRTAREVAEYQQPFWSKMGDNLANGWTGLQNFFLFLASIWEVLLILGAIGYGIYRFIKFLIRKNAKVTSKK